MRYDNPTFYMQGQLPPSRIIIQTLSTSISRFLPLREVFIHIKEWNWMNIIDLSGRLDINCEFIPEPNHVIYSNPVFEI